jgi:hypothetical protein
MDIYPELLQLLLASSGCAGWTGTLCYCVFSVPKENREARNSTLRTSNTQMPTGTIEFKCIRINSKRISSFEPDENHIDSLIEFDLKIGNQRLRNLKAEVRQLNGTDFQSQPLEMGNTIGYNGPWNDEEFRPFCERYYRDVIGSSGMGVTINRGERNLLARVAIQLHRSEEIHLPVSEGMSTKPPVPTRRRRKVV